jgi:hypothetical protein
VLEARVIQAQLERVRAQISFCKRLLMLEEVFVHCPEVRVPAVGNDRRASMRMISPERKWPTRSGRSDTTLKLVTLWRDIRVYGHS